MRAYLLIVLAVYLSALWGWLNDVGRHRLEFHHARRCQPGADLCQPLVVPHDLVHAADPECCPLVGHRRHDRSSSAWRCTFRSCVTCFTSRPSIPMTWRSAWREGFVSILWFEGLKLFKQKWWA